MIVDPRTLTLRTKIIGALIRNARQFRDKSVEDCAAVIGVDIDTFQSYELGELAPSLPELEGLAYYLGIRLENFWESKTVDEQENPQEMPDMERLLFLRQRMIGAQLRQMRLEAGVQLQDLARYMQLDISQIEAYEFGQEPIPLPHLEVLSAALNRSIREFQDRHGPVGEWETRQTALQDFMAMPLDMQVFVSKPINRPYLDLAVRLSEMSVDRLRSVAEGLLEITY